MVVRTTTTLPRREAPTRKAEPFAGSAQQASECLTPVSCVRRLRKHCDSRLQVVEPSASHKGQNPSLQISTVLEDCPPRRSNVVLSPEKHSRREGRSVT